MKESRSNLISYLYAYRTVEVVKAIRGVWKHLSLAGDYLYVADGKKLQVFDVNSTEKKWECKTESSIGEPIIYQGMVFFEADSRSIFSLK